jgi:hypothetical protein
MLSNMGAVAAVSFLLIAMDRYTVARAINEHSPSNLELCLSQVGSTESVLCSGIASILSPHKE